ncbi:MAG: PD40 domain-containing protein [Candidatus Latescibacteria bacterium]|nr:PD40 domain-containing protein [Candidatus Latescibacterota bacterium]
MHRCVTGLLALVLLAPAPARAVEGYYRQPALHGDAVVFVAEGDLWRVPATGGEARRLTTHLEAESNPAISPDGRLLAFSASYEGPTEVYVMPLEGGLPRRLTYEGQTAAVVGWTPAGEVLYRSSKRSTLPSSQLLRVPATGGAATPLPLAQAAEGCLDPADGTLYFTRFAQQGSHTRRYRGGTAQNLWRLRPGADEADPLTADYPGTSRSPMLWQGRLYFVSDRDGSMNLWSMATDGGDLRQLTRHRGWDVREPCIDAGRIVYRLGADLRLFTLATGEDRRLRISLLSDLEQMRERWVDKPMDYLSAAHLSPAGDRVVLTARGQVFVAPVKQGRLVELGRAPGVRYRQARFAPDGASVLLLSDQTGEVEWWRLAADGMSPAAQLSRDGRTLRFDGVPSPDGKWIATWDQNQELHLVDLERGRSRKVADSPLWEYDPPRWSADSRWFVYGVPAASSFTQLMLYDVRAETSTPITSDRYESVSPAWSADGKWLYFLSDRHFHSLVGNVWGRRQPEPYFDAQTQLFALALTDDPAARFPFAPDDELAGKGDGADKEATKDAASTAPAIALDGLAGRLYALPVPPGNYRALSANGSRLFWLAWDADGADDRRLMALDIGNDDPEPVTLATGVDDYELSADGEHLLLRRGDALAVIGADSGANADLGDAGVDLAGWRFALDPREEWRQMFVESWRLERDYFYDPAMHGLDWRAVLEKYLPLVDRVTDRAELSDLQGQMAAELSALHVYVYGGDHRDDAADVNPAGLGAVLEPDEGAGGWRVARIYAGDPEQPDALSPLARPEVGVVEGDVITAVNGIPALSVDAPGRLLRDQAGKQVRLSLASRGKRKGRDVIVTPLAAAAERELRYTTWEVERRERVETLGEGKLGYVHLRAMGPGDIADWERDFYPVFARQGLIVDVRHNGGGNIDSWILERLMRRAWMYWAPRVGDSTSNMQYAFRGHLVVLINEWTASDGEVFAEGFRRLGLGPVIGTRSWGGEIWLTSSNTLVDAGIVTAPEFGVYGPEGAWLIEGHGVDPDVVVDNLPAATFRGEDAQLAAAVDTLLARIARDPRPVPPPPAHPVMPRD